MADTFSLARVDTRLELEATVGALAKSTPNIIVLYIRGSKYVTGSSNTVVVSDALGHANKLELWDTSTHQTRVEP